MCTQDLMTRFSRDQAGSYTIIVALLLPVLAGIAGLGTEASLWLMSHRSLQDAADSAAFSGATSRATGDILFREAGAVTAAYGYANGVSGVTVTVNRPPTSGNYTGTANAVEVFVQQPQNRFMSALFGSGQVTIRARAVAIPGNAGLGCVLSLDGAAPGATTGQGSTTVNLINCSLYDNSSDGSALTVGGSATISAYSVGVVGGYRGRPASQRPMASRPVEPQRPIPTPASQIQPRLGQSSTAAAHTERRRLIPASTRMA